MIPDEPARKRSYWTTRGSQKRPIGRRNVLKPNRNNNNHNNINHCSQKKKKKKKKKKTKTKKEEKAKVISI